MMQQPYYAAQPYGQPYGQPVIWRGAPPPKQTLVERHHRCNDICFSFLFFVHLGVIAYVTAKYVPLAINQEISIYNNNNNDNNSNNNANNNSSGEQIDNSSVHAILILIAIVGGITVLVSTLTMNILIYCAHGLITAALIFNIISFGLVATQGIIMGNPVVITLGAMMTLLAIWFACSVWIRIPFAAANLETATRAIRDNFGVTIFAYMSLIISFLWNVWFMVAFSSFIIVENSQYTNQNGSNDDAQVHQSQSPEFYLYLFLFSLSYYWTYQVIKNHVHVTVAGTVGTWWFLPQEAASCCSCAVCASFYRASTYSFGSICMGSLLVAIIQAMKEVLNYMRESDDGIILCLAQCCLSCIESIAEYFNQWAYVYVGLYGYNFLEAGQQVISLFTARGWTVIVADYLVDRVLLMVSVLVGLVIGILAIVIAEYSSLNVSVGNAFL